MGRKASAAVLIIAILLAIAFAGCMEKKPAKNDSTNNARFNTTGNLTVHYLDVGQGDSELIQFVGKNILIDGGEVDQGSRVVSYLRSYGVSSLDLVVATHPHSDHIGGLVTVLKTFPVKNFLDSGQTYSSQTYENLLKLVDQKNINYTVAVRGQKISLDPQLQITVLNPPAQPVDDNVNDNSVVLKITYGEISFLFMGDAETPAEKSMLASGLDLHADILKAGHHGSSTSSSPEFIKAVDPDIKIIEVGANNDYHHPAPKTLNTLMQIGAHIQKSAVYRTDLSGTIDITTDGRSYYITTEKGSGQSSQMNHLTQTAQANQTKQLVRASPVSQISTGSQVNQPVSMQSSMAQPNATYSVAITATQFDAPGDDRKNLNGEWVEIANSGNSPVDMANWILDSSGERVYTFPEFSLASGASAKVFTGKGVDSASELYIGMRSPVWNNKGDTATLKDATGHIVSQRSG